MRRRWNQLSEAMKIAVFTSAVGLLGVLLGALPAYLLLGDNGTPPTSVPATEATASSTSLPPTTTADPLSVVVDSAGSLSYAVPVPPEKLVGAPSPQGDGCDSQARRDWVAALGGVPTAQHSVSVVVQAIGNEVPNIVITGLELHATHRPAGNLKTHIRLCGGGGIPMRYLHLQLGDPRSQVQIYDQDKSGKNEWKPVKHLTLQLRRGEAARFLIVTTAVGPPGVIYEWSVDLIAIVDGKRRLYRIADDGRPFRYATEAKSWQIWTDLSGPAAGRPSTTIR